MKVPKLIGIGAISLFLMIGIVSIFKNKSENGEKSLPEKSLPAESRWIEEVVIDYPKEEAAAAFSAQAVVVEEAGEEQGSPVQEADRIDLLFTTDASKLPIVETITYSSRVPWLKGRPAWIADYASYYETSRHFIARSLNRSKDYYTQKVAPGDRFNVLAKDKPVEFYLVIDLSQCRLYFYGVDKAADERFLLKTYPVGVGRKDPKRASGYLTPTGKYSLGEKVAIYKPGSMGYFQDQKIEMIRVFGTRWIPFDREIEGCTDGAKGYGIHGVPWEEDLQTKELREDCTRLGKYDSDGCIRLASEDIEEIFAIVISKPTVVEIVKEFAEAHLPGSEK